MLLALPAGACLNDRDSDAVQSTSITEQARQFPDTLRVISGRFERNPPLYYQRRIDHSRALLQKSPHQFGLYDDIAVAYDRLGNHRSALQWMQRKRAVLPKFDAHNAANKEAWYRYFANDGTFRVHLWLGTPRRDTKELDKARAEIKRAIDIKPNAHLGRERYQLMAMDWMAELVKDKNRFSVGSLGSWISAHDHWEEGNGHSASMPRRQKAVVGLSGLIVLGAAWQSLDVFEALSDALSAGDTITLRYLALKRCKELKASGKHSLNPDDVHDDINVDFNEYPYGPTNEDARAVQINRYNQATLDNAYTQLRHEADMWNTSRQKWIETRLKRGLHPDWSPNFWQGYSETQAPSIDVYWDKSSPVKKEAPNDTPVFLLTVAAIIFVILVSRLVALRKRQGQATA